MQGSSGDTAFTFDGNTAAAAEGGMQSSPGTGTGESEARSIVAMAYTWFEHGERQPAPLHHGVDHIALEIVKIEGHDEDQVPGPKLLDQSGTDLTGLWVMDMVNEEYLKLVVNIVMKVSPNNCRP